MPTLGVLPLLRVATDHANSAAIQYFYGGSGWLFPSRVGISAHDGGYALYRAWDCRYIFLMNLCVLGRPRPQKGNGLNCFFLAGGGEAHVP